MSEYTFIFVSKCIFGQIREVMKNSGILNEGKLQKFRNKKVMKKDEISVLLNCSGRTAQRKLNLLKILRSYNQNGQYYALQSVARFDSDGLWFFNKTCFSKFGSLRQTVVGIVNNSQSGMTALEISSKLKLAKNSFLTFFKGLSEIQREKLAGSYVYFSVEASIYQNQRENRILKYEPSKNSYLTDTLVLLVFVEKINNPEYDELALSESLKKRGINLSPLIIVELLKKYGVKKKIILTWQ